MNTIPTPEVAITVIQPYPTAIALRGHADPKVAAAAKPIENRTWAPRAALLGKRIAIHAGVKPVDLDALEQILIAFPDLAPYLSGKLPRGAIIATATLLGHVTAGGCVNGEWCMSRTSDVLMARATAWFTGPIGHVYGDVHILPEPIPCRGALGYWKIGAVERAAIAKQERAAA